MSACCADGMNLGRFGNGSPRRVDAHYVLAPPDSPEAATMQPQAPKRKLDATDPSPVDEPVAKRTKAAAFPILDLVPDELRDDVERIGLDIQRLVEAAAKDTEVPAHLQGYLVDEDEPSTDDELPEPTGVPGKGGKIKGLSRKGVMDIVVEHVAVARAGWASKGKWTADGTASGKAPKNERRDLQLANQLSQALIEALALSGTSTQEVEVMLVNDRVLVSANEREVVAKLVNSSLNEWFYLLAQHLEDDQLEPWAERKIDKIMPVCAAMLGGHDDDWSGTLRLADLAVSCAAMPRQLGPVRAALRVLANADQPIIDGGKPPTAAKFITADAYAGRIIAVAPNADTADPKSHAEQNLALALVHCDHDGSVAIAGGKRPCTICYLSLRLAQHWQAPRLRINEHPGGFWSGTTETGLYDIARQLGLSLANVRETMKAYAVTEQYVTDLGDDADLATAVHNLGAAVQHQEYDTGTSTPSQSPTHHWYLEDDERALTQTK